MTDACERLWEADAIDEGRLSASDVASFERHLPLCAACRRRTEEHRRLHALGRELGDEPPSELRLRRLRARVLRDAAAPKPSPAWGMRLGLAGALCAGLIAVLALRRGGHEPAHVLDAFAGSVIAGEPAQWSQSRDGKVERVLLVEGALRVAVRKLSPGERFLVEVPDGELEVRGTRFDVVVQASKTESVRVDEGVVALRLRDLPELTLSAGQAWSAPRMPETPPAATAEPSSTGTEAAASASPPPPHLASRALASRDASADYEAAMGLYRAGRFAEAAAAFHRFDVAHPGSDLDEDATFLEALSLAGAGRTDAAALVAEQHLQRFPSSFHRKEAATLIARAARERADAGAAQSP